MAFTITNIMALTAVNAINRNQASMQQTLERLSTGYRINSAADDPAGLIASESIRADEAATTAAISNAQRADSVLATADGALSQVSSLLIDLQGLVTNSANTAGLSSDEVAANQLQVDSILSSINRISDSSSFGNTNLLNGQFSYHLSAGPNANALQGLRIQAAQVPPGGQSLQVQVLASAQHAALIVHSLAAGLTAPVSLSLTGSTGTSQLSFSSTANANTIANAINQLTNSTGITASSNGTDVALISTGYGSSQFVSVQSSSTAFQTQTLAGVDSTRSLGRDLQVSINGQPVSANGLNVNARTNNLTATFTLSAAQNTAGASAQFAITGGGANFAISPDLSTPDLSLALDPVNSANLGFSASNTSTFSLADLGSGGTLSLTSGHLDQAQQVVSNAIKQISTSRAQIGATREYDIQSTVNSLNVKLENLQSADSSIRDTDFATETANLAREQILAQSSQFALKAAEQNQQIILTLLSSINK